MNDELKFLLLKFENKMISLWQLDGQLMECNDDDNRVFSMERRSRILGVEVQQARANLVAAIEKLENNND